MPQVRASPLTRLQAQHFEIRVSSQVHRLTFLFLKKDRSAIVGSVFIPRVATVAPPSRRLSGGHHVHRAGGEDALGIAGRACPELAEGMPALLRRQRPNQDTTQSPVSSGIYMKGCSLGNRCFAGSGARSLPASPPSRVQNAGFSLQGSSSRSRGQESPPPATGLSKLPGLFSAGRAAS